MKTTKYKTKQRTYNLPAVYFTNHGYISVNKLNGNKIRSYIPEQETSKTINICELDKVNIIRTEKPLDLNVGDIYTITSPQKNGKMQFTVVSVNENDLQLKILKDGKTDVTGEFSVVDFSAFIKTLEETGRFIVVMEHKGNTTTNTKKIIIGGIVLAVGLGVAIGLKNRNK